MENIWNMRLVLRPESDRALVRVYSNRETYLDASPYQAPDKALELLVFPPANRSLEDREQPNNPLPKIL